MKFQQRVVGLFPGAYNLQAAVKSGASSVSAGTKTGYLPTLDGWRAIAILAVVFQHDRLYSLGPVGTLWLYDHGRSGVDLFFTISGLLICWRLLQEEQVFGRISLRRFYIRRAFRILPPAIVFLAVIAVLALTGVIRIGLREWFGSLLFFRNYTSPLGHMWPDSFFTGHFWSLSVEEHFYLFLPTFLLFTGRNWRLPILLVLTFLIGFHRMRVLESREWDHVLFHTDIRIDGLLIPASVAILVQSNKWKERLRNWLRIWPVLLIAAIIVVSNWEGQFWQTTLVALLLSTTILGTVLNPHTYLAMALEWPPLRYLGRISYSIYLWQQLFFTGHYSSTIGYPLGIIERTPLRFVLTLALAMASYHLLERPMIILGHKLAPPATPGRDDLSGPARAASTPASIKMKPDNATIATE